MAQVIIPESDSKIFKRLQSAHSVEAHTIVTDSHQHDFQKGSTVTVSFIGKEIEAMIVSDPVVVQDGTDGKKTLSLKLKAR